jgi:hypothetical protein
MPLPDFLTRRLLHKYFWHDCKKIDDKKSVVQNICAIGMFKEVIKMFVGRDDDRSLSEAYAGYPDVLGCFSHRVHPNGGMSVKQPSDLEFIINSHRTDKEMSEANEVWKRVEKYVNSMSTIPIEEGQTAFNVFTKLKEEGTKIPDFLINPLTGRCREVIEEIQEIDNMVQELNKINGSLSWSNPLNCMRNHYVAGGTAGSVAGFLTAYGFMIFKCAVASVSCFGGTVLGAAGLCAYGISQQRDERRKGEKKIPELTESFQKSQLQMREKRNQIVRIFSEYLSYEKEKESELRNVLLEKLGQEPKASVDLFGIQRKNQYQVALDYFEVVMKVFREKISQPEVLTCSTLNKAGKNSRSNSDESPVELQSAIDRAMQYRCALDPFLPNSTTTTFSPFNHLQ